MDCYPKAKKVYLNHLNKIYDYQLIKNLHDEHSYNINFSCKVLKISRASYYKWLNSTPTEKQIEDEKIVLKIKDIATSNNSLFGVMKMFHTLRNQGWVCGHNRVYRLMCINEIQSTYHKRKNYHYKRSTPEIVAENILKRDFNANAPNLKWCTDVTEIKVPATGEKLYISPMIDLYDRYPVALEVSERNDANLATVTLDNAHQKFPDAIPLVHSDRGFAYTRKMWNCKLKEYGMKQSMSRVSRCIDNGVCEGFQGLFKDILFILYPNIKTKEEMIKAIFGTLDYYINHYPQKRFKGKTCGQVRAEAMKALWQNEAIVAYPIKQANGYIKFWAEIESKKQKKLQQI